MFFPLLIKWPEWFKYKHVLFWGIFSALAPICLCILCHIIQALSKFSLTSKYLNTVNSYLNLCYNRYILRNMYHLQTDRQKSRKVSHLDETKFFSKLNEDILNIWAKPDVDVILSSVIVKLTRSIILVLYSLTFKV